MNCGISLKVVKFQDSLCERSKRCWLEFREFSAFSCFRALLRFIEFFFWILYCAQVFQFHFVFFNWTIIFFFLSLVIFFVQTDARGGAEIENLCPLILFRRVIVENVRLKFLPLFLFFFLLKNYPGDVLIESWSCMIRRTREACQQQFMFLSSIHLIAIRKFQRFRSIAISVLLLLSRLYVCKYIENNESSDLWVKKSRNR